MEKDAVGCSVQWLVLKPLHESYILVRWPRNPPGLFEDAPLVTERTLQIDTRHHRKLQQVNNGSKVHKKDK